jgi:hypothetical protein
MKSLQNKVVLMALAALTAGAALSAAGGAAAAGDGCVAPDVVGVSLGMARHALSSSGCGVTVRELPAHGSFVTPARPDARQLVARQSPRGGARAAAVTVFVEPLCAQPALPGPKHVGAEQSRGATELIAALYLQGGPVKTSPHCRNALPQGGTVTVSTAAGALIASRRVRGGHFAVFPLAPGGYVLAGTLSSSPRGGLVAVPPTAFTIAAHRTTHVNAVARVP